MCVYISLSLYIYIYMLCTHAYMHAYIPDRSPPPPLRNVVKAYHVVYMMIYDVFRRV